MPNISVDVNITEASLISLSYIIMYCICIDEYFMKKKVSTVYDVLTALDIIMIKIKTLSGFFRKH